MPQITCKTCSGLGREITCESTAQERYDGGQRHYPACSHRVLQRNGILDPVDHVRRDVRDEDLQNDLTYDEYKSQ